MSDNEVSKTFDEDYVKSLRQEAANYRKQVRDLEKEVTDLRKEQFTVQVSSEFAKRGVQADPSWLRIEDGQSITEAVDSFVQSYPHLMAQPQAPVAPQPANLPNALPPQAQNVNAPGPNPSGGSPWWWGKLDDIKKDPAAREQLSREYAEGVRGPRYQAPSPSE